MLTQLPANLPVPLDDGACDHLPGLALPNITLMATDGADVNLRQISGWVVLYCYPMTGRPDTALPDGWDLIPGARGCTPQACAYADHHAQLNALGAQVFGLSQQSTAYQQEAANRLHLPFALLSDASAYFTDALRLPTFEVAGQRLNKRLTMILRDGVIATCFYPVFPPDQDALQVMAWLKNSHGVAHG